MDTINSLLFGIFNTSGNEERCGNDIVGNYTVDTCFTVDQGYETAIWKGNGEIIVVQRHANKEEAIKGHALWIEYCKLNPVCVYSPQTDRVEVF